MKDFYDIWLLPRLFSFEGNVLRKALENTFDRRRTAFPSSTPFAFTPAFYEDPQKTMQWTRFIQIGSAKKLGQKLNEQGYRTKAWTTKKGKVREGPEWNTAHIYRLLNNRIYIGEIAHKDRSYPGEHEGSSTGRPGTRFRPSWPTTGRLRCPWPEPKWSLP